MYNENELKHYGVLGMKWGVHRAVKRLGNPDTHDSAAAKLEIHRGKINKKLSSLDTRGERLSKKAYKAETRYATKAAKLERKSNKLKYKASKARNSDKYADRMGKASKLDYKAAKIKEKAAKAKAAMAKNERLKNLYNSGLSQINEALLRKGQAFCEQ